MKHTHDCSHHSHEGDGNIGVAFFLNLSFTIISFAGGIFTNSVAIISDAIHNFGDCLSLAMAWYFQRLSKKGSTREYSYGYKRFSLLGAIITSIILVVGSIYILQEAIPRLLSPQETNAKGMFVLAIVGVAVNGIAALKTYKSQSINERVVSLHLLEDALGWIAVLLGSVVIYFTNITIIDPILSIAIACFVLISVVRTIRQTMPILLQGAPSEIDQEHIVETIKKIDVIADIHDLHIWALDEKYNVLTVHIALKEKMSVENLVELKNTIREILAKKNIQHATIEFEHPDELCAFESCV